MIFRLFLSKSWANTEIWILNNSWIIIVLLVCISNAGKKYTKICRLITVQCWKLLFAILKTQATSDLIIFLQYEPTWFYNYQPLFSPIHSLQDSWYNNPRFVCFSFRLTIVCRIFKADWQTVVPIEFIANNPTSDRSLFVFSLTRV